jgi:hypothetical protein
MSGSKFSRHINSNIIKKLKATDLWTKKLSMDCLNGNVFLAIRPNNTIRFYYKGGGLFDFGSKGFSTNVKYAVVINKPFAGEIYENHLPNADLIRNFLEGYDGIKKNCELYSKKSEAQGVSCIYHKYPYTSDKSNVVVLDIEITASGESDKRIDILLFNKKLKELRFIEAKLSTNDEIKSKTRPQVLDQLDRYQNMIAKRNDFLPAYQEYTDTLNEIFCLKLPKPQIIDNKVGLLIFDFDEDQKEGRLEQIIKNLTSQSPNISVYPIGEIKNINAENLWKKTN